MCFERRRPIRTPTAAGAIRPGYDSSTAATIVCGVQRRRRRSLVYLGVLTTVALLGGAGGTGGAALAAAGVPNAFFTSACSFSHRNSDDLIRFPRKPGASHNHTYFGNRSTNAFSVLATLRSAATTCDRLSDTAAYWVPTVYADAQPIVPTKASVYYRRETVRNVVAFPPGFRVVAGDMMARKPQSLRIVSWDCRAVGSGSGRATSSVPTCPPNSQLELSVSFPSCWDGHSLDSPDHTSHVAYPIGTRCPSRRPVPLPALTLVVQFPPIAPGRTVTLASGGQFSAHADFVNSWQQKDLVQLVTLCLNEARGCGQLPPHE